MEDQHKAVLRKCRVKLVQDLSVNDFFDRVEACSLLTNLMLEAVKGKETRADKVRCFLDYLVRRGPDAFDKFIRCLRESGHEHLINHISKVCPINESNFEGTVVSIRTQETPEPHDVEMVENIPNEISPNEREMMELSPLVQSGVQETSSSTGSPVLQESPSTLSLSSSISSLDSPEMGPSTATFSSSVTPRGYSANYDEEYKMESNPRGYLLIINNKEFSTDLGIRTGTDIDCDNLKTLFESLGFLVEVRSNLSALEMKVNLQLLSKYDRLKNVDCLAIALLTHGHEDYLYGIDGRFIHVNEAFHWFTAENCPALHNKPKFFIINACRGDAEDNGSLTSGVYQTEGFVSADMGSLGNTVGCRIPNMKDFLVAYSTIPGHVSWRHLNEGSFFIQGFVSVFQRYASTMDVLDMLVKVNNEVSKKVDHQGVQIPAPQVMLTKKWYLNPIVRTLV